MKRAVTILAAIVVLASACQTRASERFTLPSEIMYPEGIAYDARSGMIFTANATNGTIVQVNARSGATNTIPIPDIARQIGTAFPAILGMNIDSRGRLWLAGGRTGKVFVIDPRSGRLIQTITTPEAEKGLINDIAFAAGKAFFTDTLRPTLWAVDVGETIAATPEAYINFEGTPLQYTQGANLNGIVATPDGKSLIAGQMNKGQLYRIDVASRQVAPIDLEGQTLEGVDGLVLRDRTLYVIRQPQAEIATVQLSPDLTSGGVVKRTKVEGLLWPATGVIVGGELMVVNTQFNKRATNDPETPFTLQRVPLATLAAN